MSRSSVRFCRTLRPLLFTCAFLFAPAYQAHAADPPAVTCHTWAVVDGESGDLLWGVEVDAPRKTASTTKIMCAHVILNLAQEHPEVLDEIVTFSQLADDTGGSTADVRVGEQVAVRECLYGLLLPSGNDAGNALAEHFNDRFEPPGDSGDHTHPVTPESHPTRANFIAEMNRTAQSLGMTNTFYRSSYGDGGNENDRTTTARDLLKLAHAALQNPRFAEYVSTREYGTTVATPEGGQRPVVWNNTNQLLGSDGYDGVKTGTTNQAGQCLVSSGHHGDDHLLMVVLGSEDRYADSRNLYEWAWTERAAPVQPVAVGQPGTCADDGDLEQVIAGRQIGETREESGRLSSTDETLESGEYVDEYTFRAEKGDMFVIDLYSGDLDPYLMVREESDASEFQLDNDDHGSDTTRSQITFMAHRKSEFAVLATSYEPGETGAYRLTIRQLAPVPDADNVRRKETGTLVAGDDQLEDGEFVDTYPLAAEPGELFQIDLNSTDFDTYLLVTGPDGSEYSVENDDFAGSMSHSQILLLAPVAGNYAVQATSYEGGETGAYLLTIRQQ